MILWCLLVLIVYSNAALLHQIVSPSVSKKFGQLMAVNGNRLIAADDDTLWAYKWGFNKWDFTGLVGAGHLGEIKEIVMGDNATVYIVYQQNVTHGAISLYSLVNEEWLGFGDLSVADVNFGRSVTYYDGELAILGDSVLYKIYTNFTVTPSTMDACVETLSRVSTADYMGGCPGVGISLNTGAVDTASPHDVVVQMEEYVGGLPGVITGVALNSTGGSISLILGGFGLSYALTSPKLINETIYGTTGFYDDDGFTVLVGFMNASSTGGIQVLRFDGTSSTWSELDRFTDESFLASFYGMNADYSDLGLYVTSAHMMGTNDGTIYTYSSGDYQLQTTDGPTASPTGSPTVSPTVSPTGTPTVAPTGSPTETGVTPNPTASPSMSPTGSPTETTTVAPTDSPTTASPSASPTSLPTEDDPDDLPTVVIITFAVAGGIATMCLVYMCCGTPRASVAVAVERAAVYDF